MKSKEMGVLDLILIIAKHRVMVLIICVLAAGGAIAYSLITPLYWKSFATLKPVTDSDGISSFGADMMNMIGGGFINTPQSEICTDFINVMQRREFREDVVKKFNLIPYFKIKKPDPSQAMALAIHQLQGSMVDINYDEESGLVNIAVETKDKVLSRDIAQYYLDYLANYNAVTKMSKGKMKREFLEKQVQKQMHEADSLALAFKDFQVKNRSIAIDKQTESMIGLYSESVAMVAKTKLEYDLAKIQYAPDTPQLVNLEKKLRLLEDKMRELEGGKSSISPKYLLQIDKIPDLNMQYAQFMIDEQIKQKIIEYIYPQYEIAKLEELKDLPTFEVYDKPQIAGIRSKPKRALIVVLITLAAFLAACIIALAKDSIFSENKEKVSQIIAALKGKG